MNPTNQPSTGLELGVYTLGDHIPNPHTGQRISQQQRIKEIIQLGIEVEKAGLDFYSIGESHQAYFVAQAHAVILGAVAQATSKIKLASSSTILSTSDPVRVFENFATLDLISDGRMEIIAGRASRIGLFELLGYDVRDYDALFEEKFDLLRLINENELVNWSGNFRKELKNAAVLPRPKDGRQLPIWRATGGHTSSAIQAGRAGVPLFLAYLSGPVSFHLNAVNTYRQTLTEYGYDAETTPLGTGGFFYVAETSQKARQEAYPYFSHGFQHTNGQAFPKRAFANSEQLNDVMNIGSPQAVIEKILYQYETFGMSRYGAQFDYGGMPYDQIMRNLEYLAVDIMPAVKKYTRHKVSARQEPADESRFKEDLSRVLGHDKKE